MLRNLKNFRDVRYFEEFLSFNDNKESQSSSDIITKHRWLQVYWKFLFANNVKCEIHKATNISIRSKTLLLLVVFYLTIIYVQLNDLKLKAPTIFSNHIENNYYDHVLDD